MGICRLPQEIVVPSATKPLANCTWEEISYVASNNLASEWGWQVGDAKEIILNGTVGSLTLNNYQTYAYIIGINHNAAVEGNNLIHFQIGKSALTGGVDIAFDDFDIVTTMRSFKMNTSRTNSGGWEDSYMRNSICGTSLTDYPATSFLAVLPDELRAVLKPITRYTNNRGNSTSQSAVTATTDYIFLLGYYEVFGDTIQINEYEASYQQQYDYYKSEESRIKYRHNDLTDHTEYWLCSPRLASGMFMTVSTSGERRSEYADGSFGFSPCFCV